MILHYVNNSKHKAQPVPKPIFFHFSFGFLNDFSFRPVRYHKQRSLVEHSVLILRKLQSFLCPRACCAVVSYFLPHMFHLITKDLHFVSLSLIFIYLLLYSSFTTFSLITSIYIILRSEMSERSIMFIEPPKKEAPSLVELELEPASVEVKVTYLCI